MENKVSIIMPVYNGEKYIKTAINSALNQSYKNFELIIVNDGSTDQTENIIQSYNDERILYIKSFKNLGEFTAPLIGYAIAKSRYVTMLDSDDILPKHSLELRLKNIKDYDAIHGGITQLVNNEERYIKPLNTNSVENILSFLKHHHSSTGINLPIFFIQN